MDELWKKPAESPAQKDGATQLPIDKRRYVRSTLPMEALVGAFKQANIL